MDIRHVRDNIASSQVCQVPSAKISPTRFTSTSILDFTTTSGRSLHQLEDIFPAFSLSSPKSISSRIEASAMVQESRSDSLEVCALHFTLPHSVGVVSGSMLTIIDRNDLRATLNHLTAYSL